MTNASYAFYCMLDYFDFYIMMYEHLYDEEEN